MDNGTDWTNYSKIIELCKPVMREKMVQLAKELGIDESEIDEIDYDDFSYSFEYKNQLDISFSIWDSGDADDGIYGKHGNFIFQVVDKDGRVICQCIPLNYTSNVWVDYTDSEAWENRLNAIDLSEAISYIKKWENKKRLLR